MSRARFLLTAAAAVVVVVLVWSCKSVPTVAPTGAVTTLFANPLDIAAGGSSQLTVSVFEASGQPVPDGTVVNLTTTLGTVTPSRLEMQGGFGQALLTVGSQIGDAVITASSGASTPSTVTVLVGGIGATITMVASPSSLSVGGGSSTLTATLLGALGEPLTEKRVVFETSDGSLASGGSPLSTDAAGQVTDTLTTTTDALVSVTVLGTGEAATANVDVEGTGIATITVTPDPEMIGPLARGETEIVNLQAEVLDADGVAVRNAGIVFSTDAGELTNTGVVSTNSSGIAFNTLETDRATNVTATGAGASGTVLITLQRPVLGTFVSLELSPGSIETGTVAQAPADCLPHPDGPNYIDVTLVATVTFDSVPVEAVPVTFFAEQLNALARTPSGKFCEFPPVVETDDLGIAVAHYQISEKQLLACDAILTPCPKAATAELPNVCPPFTPGTNTAINPCCCGLEFGARASGLTNRKPFRVFAELDLPNRACSCVF